MAGGGHSGAVLLVPFFGQNAGAALRAPVPWRVQGRARGPAGGCLPFRSRWLSRPASGAATARRSKSADSNDHIDVVLTNTLERRAAYPSTCAVGEHRVRARPDGGAACPVGAGGRAVRARGAATVRSGAVWRCFCSQHFFGRNAGAALRAPAVPWQVQERVRGLAGGLPTRPEPVAEPSGLGRRHSALACVERSTSWWRTARVSWEFCGSSPACTPVLTVSGGGQECGAAPRAAGSPRAVCPGRGERPLRVA